MNKELTPLEALQIIRHTTNLDMPNELNGYQNELDIIETALKDYEKQEETKYILLGARYNGKTANLRALIKLKAFEIIKEKKVNVNCIISGWTLGKYNSYQVHISLTQEEYDLLKEVLL